MNLNMICVYDWETDSPKPDKCNPVQLGAVIIDPRKLDFVEGAYFNSDMRPSDFDEEDYVSSHKDTIEWHSKIQGCTVEKVLERWDAAPDQESVWKSFNQWLTKYHTRQARQSKFSAPIRAGYNIEDFDDIITKRLCKRYGQLDKSGDMKIFHPRDRVDMLRYVWWWFENQVEPKSYTMDEMRKVLGLTAEKAHDALKDVYDEGQMLIRLLKTQRWLTAKLLEQGKLGKKNGNVQIQPV